jgi:tRNA A37 threonylcarbamoyladenosine dehydratase
MVFTLFIAPMRLSEIENHLKKFRVGIAGAGGLGSNCAAALARTDRYDESRSPQG